ncbi:septation protein SepH [Kribbella sp. CA-253562]|uniref:septation protein SepH n=1 Tax=Kribbella sp. CA-253562 TaxID=3239942 RepID=UPI003D8E111A
MREARLVGLSQDGTKLVLAVAETGEEFAVPVDDRLRAALRGDRARLGQLEIQMESALRPRDIQARIRAGESPEAVAAVAQMPMERVMAFAGPVLAERDHVANLAQRASVRRRGGGDAPTRNLGAWVTERLRIRGVDPNAAEWDAWRREDGRWAVRVSYPVAEDDEKVAMFAYDAPGRYAVPDDDEARWLVGEQAQVMPPQQPERRLTAVADIDLSLAPDHGADSYEAAGFEDTVNLNRARQYARDNNPRDFGQDIDRDFGRDPQSPVRDRPFPREAAGRDNSGRELPGREAAGRDFARDSVRESFTGRDVERGPRRVHSVPSADEEPTLINIPTEPPPTLRPTVRAVERPAQPPTESPVPAPPEERAAAPENPFTERRTPPPAPERPAEARQSEAGPAERPAEARRAESAPSERRPDVPQPDRPAPRDTQRPVEAGQPAAAPEQTARPAIPKPFDPRRVTQENRPSQPTLPTPNQPALAPQPAADAPARPAAGPPQTNGTAIGSAASASAPQPGEQAEAPAEPAPEPKKKPARRGSKRASVPSWDEIMFGKKAD